MLQDKARETVVFLHNEKGFSYSMLAKKLGVSRGYVSLWLKNERNFSFLLLNKLQEVL
jgi:transcriptional regulator with XRE-family HTH domain